MLKSAAIEVGRILANESHESMEPLVHAVAASESSWPDVLSCTNCGVAFSSSCEIRRVRWYTAVHPNEVDTGKVFVPSRVFTAPPGVSLEQVVMDTFGLDAVGETMEKLASSGIPRVSSTSICIG